MFYKRKMTAYVAVWLLYAVLQSLAVWTLAGLPYWMLLLDAVCHALLFGVLGVMLWLVLRYGNYDKMPLLHRAVNYTALGVFSVGVWLALGHAFDYVMGAAVAGRFVPLLPLNALLGVLVYVFMIFFIRYVLLKQAVQEEAGVRGGAAVPVQPDEGPVAAIPPSEAAEALERVAVKSGNKIHVVPVQDIYYLEADGDYVHIHTGNGKYMKEQTMKYFSENLPEAQFVRVHRSYIVNVQAISRIEQYEKQNQLLTLKNGDRIKVSVGGYRLLKLRLGL